MGLACETIEGGVCKVLFYNELIELTCIILFIVLSSHTKLDYESLLPRIGQANSFILLAKCCLQD